MIKRNLWLAVCAGGLVLLLGAAACASGPGGPKAASDSPSLSTAANASEGPTTTVAPALEEPKIWVVYSSVDDDAQILVNVGATEPIATLTVTAPNGRVIDDLRIDDAGKIGQATVTLESPEPKLDQLKASYPAGTYIFAATTVTGRHLEAQTQLSYDLLTPPVIVSPTTGSIGVAPDGLLIRWKPVKGATRIHFEIEPEKAPPTGAPANPKYTIDLPGDATEIAVPDGWLKPGVEYVFDVKAIASNSSVSVTDATFTTR